MLIPTSSRVGNDFYFSTTTFIDVPGLTLLHSRDLVHWEIVTHLVPQLTGSPNYNITNGVQNYGNGVFASSLRYYNGILYCAETQNGQSARIYYSTNIAGPWQFNQLSVGAFDPGLFIENGTGYIVRCGWLAKQYHVLYFELSVSGVIATHVITNGLGWKAPVVIARQLLSRLQWAAPRARHSTSSRRICSVHTRREKPGRWPWRAPGRNCGHAGRL